MTDPTILALVQQRDEAQATAVVLREVLAAPEEAAEQLVRLTRFLHSRRLHPDFEYASTTGPRKYWDSTQQPPGEGWEPNLDVGDRRWMRYDHYEESFWRRRIVEEGS